ncbi:MAG: SOS mutagenesis and repair protein UmuC [Candidatus Dojkabacteria bacterium]|nr:MAG: SOS mutagenesis and repair protein UmuC [Candidatus Dojkabacteria bacterium]
MIFLIDCNNFYTSCEEIFNPKLKNFPCVVLSSNDGCVVARSRLAKQIGIPMGIPVFKIRNLIENYNVQLFSANFSLYGDISNRVMQTIKTFGFEIEQYSIDEAFVYVDEKLDFQKLAFDMQKKIKQWCGIPVSIGIAPTKTLAKLANYHAKKFSEKNISYIDNIYSRQWSNFFKNSAITEVWGIGYRNTIRLNKIGIYTLFDFLNADRLVIKKTLGINGVRTQMELKGIPTISKESFQTSKSIVTSRSFGKNITSLNELKETVSTFANNVSIKLRKQNALASYVFVVIYTNKFSSKSKQYYAKDFIALDSPTNSSQILIDNAIKILEKIYKKGYEYKKSMVGVWGIFPSGFEPKTLFDDKNNLKLKNLDEAIDKINLKIKKDGIKYAVMGLESKWIPKSNMKSSKYTTNWNEILEIKI